MGPLAVPALLCLVCPRDRHVLATRPFEKSVIAPNRRHRVQPTCKSLIKKGRMTTRGAELDPPTPP
jgi:hypothetical protein